MHGFVNLKFNICIFQDLVQKEVFFTPCLCAITGFLNDGVKELLVKAIFEKSPSD